MYSSLQCYCLSHQYYFHPVHIFQTNIVLAPVGVDHAILFHVVVEVFQSSFKPSVFIVCLDLPTTILDIIVLVVFVILPFFARLDWKSIGTKENETFFYKDFV